MRGRRGRFAGSKRQMIHTGFCLFERSSALTVKRNDRCSAPGHCVAGGLLPFLYQPIAKYGGRGAVFALHGQVGEVAPCWKTDTGKWRDQAAGRDVVANQGGRSHRHTQSIDRGLNGQKEVIECQRRRRSDARLSGL